MSVPDSLRIDLGADAHPVFERRRLFYDPPWYAPWRYKCNVFQSFGFDHLNNRIYIVHPTSDEPFTSGDLTITQTGLEGRVRGHMYVKGFGHGSQMGLQSRGPGEPPYLWTESHAKVHSGKAWGSRICRFRFEDGATLETTTSRT